MTDEERKKLVKRLKRLISHIAEVAVLSRKMHQDTMKICKEIGFFHNVLKTGGSIDEFKFGNILTGEKVSMEEVLNETEKSIHRILRFLRSNLEKAPKKD